MMSSLQPHKPYLHPYRLWYVRLGVTLLAVSVVSLLTACSPASPPEQAGTPPTPTAQASVTPTATSTDSTTPATTIGTIKFKQENGSEVFSLKLKSDGAKLVDAADQELARLTVDADQKVKIKDARDQPLGYVVADGDHWKLESADQTQELYILRRQADGDYKLEDAQDTLIYRIKQRDYGYEIESPDDQSLYKIKTKEGKTSLRNAQDETVMSTKDAIAPMAMACFGFEKLTQPQQAALAYAVNLTEGR